mmetsp:Transcript_27985/g.47285  ORF Transcript_27985/g.47285 Transcript_27985/m.47285 type:complete len:905 (+) Transcript_27985:54-2768(+)
MLYTFLFLTVLLSQLSSSDAGIPTVSTQSRASMTNRGAMDALNNLVVIGSGEASSLGDITFHMYTYGVTGATLDGDLAADNFIGTTPVAVIPAVAADLAGVSFDGLGHDVAIADSSTVFVSQTSLAKQTGRVVVYEGNVTAYTQKQLLIPYDGKHRQDSSAAFGESIAAKADTLAAGCQLCNSSAPIFSGAVYVYKPNKEGRWSESQVLTADGVLYLGERVAMHNNVIVAAGDDMTTFSKASSHNFANIANTVVVFEEKGPKFEQRQIITPKAGTNREEISGVAVFDETIAITTKGSDTGTTQSQRDKVYIYYPMNKRYGLEPKGKPSPQQWTNIQILTSATVTDLRYAAGAPDTSISGNELRYLTTNVGNFVSEARSTRSCLSCKFSTPVVTASAIAETEVDVMLASDANSFYSYKLVTDLFLDKPEPNSNKGGCLNIQLIDQFQDGWGIASLVVTDPDGREDKYTIQCNSANPMIFQYCPNHYAPGEYHIHIENGEETPFGWEIYYRVSAGSTWYAGDRHTHMDFLWDAKYQNFVNCGGKGLLPQTDTCKVCDPNKPAGKRRSLTNLRSLHHKGTTSSPTISRAPTILATGQGNEWNEFKTAASSVLWFDAAPGGGSKFMISDVKGQKLLREGTTCVASVATTCWVELPDGDYTIRVGAGMTDDTLSWTFCGTSYMLGAETQFEFTVVDQQCYVGAFHEAEFLCKNEYNSGGIYYLELDLLLAGGSSTLSASDESNLNVALTETMLSVVGSVPSSSKITKQTSTSNGMQLSVMLEFETSPDSVALDNFVKDTSSASSLLKYELIGTQSLAAKFLDGAVSSVSILSAVTAKVEDFSNVDESSYKTVSDHVWLTASSEQSSSNFNEYAKYVAEGAYALVAVAAVLAVSLFIKRAMAPKTAVIDA